ncbi:MAG TPA: PASTA domain-containing protein, partial [Pyrinomonadaceae bacterium]|nr:PASTA domain-containing protein [Pyrinomonadaceae bacterium]
VEIGSSDSWWGRMWAKVKDQFSSQTRYARLSARGTEYDLEIIDAHRARLTVIEGVVEVAEGKSDMPNQPPIPTPTTEEQAELTALSFFRPAVFFYMPAQDQFARELKFPTGRVSIQPLTYNIHSECLQTHRYEFRTSDSAPWFSLDGEKYFDVIGPKGSAKEDRNIQIDATGLQPGVYQAHVYAICLDCRTETKCSQAQLDWLYRITIEGPVTGPTQPATRTPSPAQSDQTFNVIAGQQSPITQNVDVPVMAPSDVNDAVVRASQVLLTTQPTYSAQNLVSHFATVAERSQNFTNARTSALISHTPGGQQLLGNVYNDWSQPAWALYAYSKEIFPNARADLAIDRGEALRMTGDLNAASSITLSADDAKLPKAQNFLGNMALDRARIALDGGNLQEVEQRAGEAKSFYDAARSAANIPPTLNVTAPIDATLRGNLAEANILAGDAALQRNSADASAMFAEAVRVLGPNPQATSIYPFTTTDLGVAFRGAGDAAVLTGDLQKANESYASAKRQHQLAIAAHSDFAEAYFNLGDLYDDLGDRENAKLNYRRAIQARPEQPAAYLPLAMLLKDEDPALAAAFAATYLRLERGVLLQGTKAAAARAIANRVGRVERPPRIGERLGGVPNVTGDSQAAAESKLAAAGFSVGKIQGRADAGMPGVVLQQIPPAGAPAPRGTKIELVISTPPGVTLEVSVPDVIGKPISEARVMLETKGLEVAEETKSDKKYPKDYVVAQNPKAPKVVKPGSTVKLTVSAGELVEIPKVKGKKLDDATKEITKDNRLTVGTIDYRPDCDVERVVEQNPLPSGRKDTPRGTAVNLVVGSLGDDPITIPTFSDRYAAEAFVNSNGLTLKKVDQVESDDPPGSVLWQKPQAGSRYPRHLGCPVNVELRVAIPVVLVDIENYIGQQIDAVQDKLRALQLYASPLYQEDENNAAGTVIQQSPLPPERVRHGTEIHLVVAKPPKVVMVPVPNVCGLSKENARAKLFNDAGLFNTDQDILLDVPPNQQAMCGADVGHVIWQSPAAGTMVPKGSKVLLVFAKVGDN